MKQKTNSLRIWSYNLNGPNFIYFILLICALCWCLLLTTAPLLAEGGSKMHIFSTMIRFFFSPICHQQASRSIQVMGHPLAVCARCSGLYFGFFIGLCMYPLFMKIGEQRLPNRWILITVALLTAIEFIFSQFNIIQMGMLFRFSSALLLGCVLPFFILPIVIDCIINLQT